MGPKNDAQMTNLCASSGSARRWSNRKLRSPGVAIDFLSNRVFSMAKMSNLRTGNIPLNDRESAAVDLLPVVLVPVVPYLQRLINFVHKLNRG